MDQINIPKEHANDILSLLNKIHRTPHTDKNKNIIYFHEVRNILKKLPHDVVISIEDKNQGQLYVECPYIFKKRIVKEIYN